MNDPLSMVYLDTDSDDQEHDYPVLYCSHLGCSWITTLGNVTVAELVILAERHLHTAHPELIGAA